MADQLEKLDIIQRHGKSFVVLCIVVAGLAFVLSKVNPDTIAAFQVAEERKACELEKLQENIKLNKCLSLAIWSIELDRQEILKCGE